MLNRDLEKIVREWRKETSQQNRSNGIRLDHGKDGVYYDCLAFADDIIFVVKNLEAAFKQIEVLKVTAEKTGLQIGLYFDKTECMNIEIKHTN